MVPKNDMSDREFILQEIKVDGRARAFEQADDSLKKDRAFVLEAVKGFGAVLEHVDESFKKDRMLVLKAVTSHGGHSNTLTKA
jgi:hypothetical protein